MNATRGAAPKVSRRFAVLFLLVPLALAACKKKPPEVVDAGEPAAVAEQPDANASDPTTTNGTNVARFGDEVKIDKVAAVIVSGNAQAREDPAGGKLLATIPKGTSVTQLAEHEGHVLVVFDNPKTPAEKLLGWVSKDVFSASAVHVASRDGGAGDGGAKDGGGAAKAVDAGAKGLRTGIGK